MLQAILCGILFLCGDRVTSEINKNEPQEGFVKICRANQHVWEREGSAKGNFSKDAKILRLFISCGESIRKQIRPSFPGQVVRKCYDFVLCWSGFVEAVKF